MLIQGYITAANGDPISTTEIRLRTIVGNELIATEETSGGFYTFVRPGNPGPFYLEWTYGGETRRAYSIVTGPSAALEVDRIPYFFQMWSNGVVPGVGDGLVVTASGSNMNVSVSTGMAIVRGILFDNLESSQLLTIDPADSQPRYDAIIVSVNPPGSGPNLEGRAELAVKKGTPSASPALPTLSTGTPYEFALAYVLVPGSASVIGSGDVSNTAPKASPIAAGSILSSHLADNAVTSSKIAANAVTSTKIANFAVTADKLAPNAVTASKLNDNIVSQFIIQDNAVVTAKINNGAVTTAKIADGAVTDVKLASNAVTTVKITNGAVTADKLASNAVTTAKIASGAVTADKLAAAGRPVFMPGTQFVATGILSSGSRTLATLGVGPLPANVQYAVWAYAGVTLRNQVNTGTLAMRVNIDGGTNAEVEYQNVGGVPRWAPVVQTAAITKGTETSFNVVASCAKISGDNTDVRAGWISVIAFPASLLAGS